MPFKPITEDRITIHPKIIRKTRKILIIWGKENFQQYPWRYTDNQWLALVAEILLQRTRANNVIPIYNQFVELYNSPGLFAAVHIEEIEKLLYTLGLRWRAKFLKQLAETLTKIEIPLEYDLLIKLPAIGDYVASAFLSLHGYKRRALIDANIVRLFCRFIGYKPDGETRREKWFINYIDELTPRNRWKDFNYAILDFSMIICKQRPLCVICPINAMCNYFTNEAV